MRGQITIFIMLGLLIVFAGAFLLYVASNSDRQANSATQQLLIEELRATTTIGQAMKSCLDDAGVEALKFLGKQGGYVRSNQLVASAYGPLTLDAVGGKPDLDSNTNPRANFIYVGSGADVGWFSVWVKNQNLGEYALGTPAGISPRYYNTTHPSALPSDFPFGVYPCRTPSIFAFFTTDTQDLPLCKKDFNLGTRIQTYLYDEAEKMGGSALALCKEDLPKGCSGSGCTCFCNSAIQDCDASLQTNLEDYIDKYFKACFAEIEIAGYDLALQTSNVEVSINEQSVGIQATPVIDVVAKATSSDEAIRIVYPTIQGEQLSVDLKSFIEGLWNQIDRAPQNERTSLLFNATANLATLPMVTHVKQEGVTYDGVNYYLYTLTLDGPQGSLRGESWEFKFAVEDRLPVLEVPKTNPNPSSPNWVERIVTSSITLNRLCAVDPDDLNASLSVVSISGGPTNPSIGGLSLDFKYPAPAICKKTTLSGLTKTGDYFFTIKALDEHSVSTDEKTYDYDTLKVEVRCNNGAGSPACSAFPGQGYCLQNGVGAGQCTTSCNDYFRNLEGTNDQYCMPSTATCSSGRASALDASCGGGGGCCQDWQDVDLCVVNDFNDLNQKGITESCMCQGVLLNHDPNLNSYCCSSGVAGRVPKLSYYYSYGNLGAGVIRNSPTELCVLPQLIPTSAFSGQTISNLRFSYADSVNNQAFTNTGVEVPFTHVGGMGTSCGSIYWHKFTLPETFLDSLMNSLGDNSVIFHRFEFWDASGTTNSMC